jgi:hypothetical protein
VPALKRHPEISSRFNLPKRPKPWGQLMVGFNSMMEAVLTDCRDRDWAIDTREMQLLGVATLCC